MKVLFDTNVVLDVLMNRAPHAELAAQLMGLAEQKDLNGLLGATTVTTIHYLAGKSLGPQKARKHLRVLLSIFDIAPVTWDVLSDALNLDFGDYEDAVLHEAARQAGASTIVTRDPKGFAKAKLTVYSPAELLSMLKTSQWRS